MSTIRIGAAVALVGALTVAVAGCSSSDDSAAAGGGASAGSGSGSEVEAAESITVWHNAADTDAILGLYESFTEETGIEVELEPIAADGFETAVQTRWATGDRPDVLEYHPTTSAAAQLNATETMQDLSGMDFVSASGDLYDNAGSLDGTVYAAITGFPSVFGLFYNKEVLGELGLDAPGTFEDLVAQCPTVEEAGVIPFYESGQSAWPTQVLPALYVADQNEGNQYGTALRTNEQSITDPDGPFINAMGAYLEVRDACFQDDWATGTFEDAIQQVFDGEAAYTALHSDTYNLWVDAAGGDEELLSETVGFAGMSSESSTVWFGPGPLGSYYAPKTGDAAKEAAALQFIEYATGDGYGPLVEEGQAFPIIDGYETPEGVSGLKQQFKDAYDAGATIGYGGDVLGYGDNIVPNLGRLLNDEITPEELAGVTQADIERASTAAGVEGW